MKEVIEDKAQTKLTATESITSWMIRHAARMQTRFSVGKDGKTPFKRRHHKDYTSQLLPLGSAVDAKVRDEDTERSKFDSRFIPGIWLGRATESDEHTVGTAQGENTVWVGFRCGREERRREGCYAMNPDWSLARMKTKLEQLRQGGPDQSRLLKKRRTTELVAEIEKAVKEPSRQSLGMIRRCNSLTS